MQEVGGGLSGAAGIGALIARQLMEEQLEGAGHDFGGGPCRVVAGAFQRGAAVLLAEALAGLPVLPAGAGIGGEPGDGVAGTVRPCGASSVELLEEPADVRHDLLQMVDLFVQRIAWVVRDRGPASSLPAPLAAVRPWPLR